MLAPETGTAASRRAMFLNISQSVLLSFLPGIVYVCSNINNASRWAAKFLIGSFAVKVFEYDRQ
jgi:hypothetical protein